MVIANSAFGNEYLALLNIKLCGLSLEHWINDGLMAIFFLLIGLELERELYVGELSSFKNALLPIIAALGGMIFPALIHYIFNAGTVTQSGIGIPMATDIAFVLGVLAILGSRVPTSLKVFVTAFAVMDDLGAIIIIAIFYSTKIAVWYLLGALAVWLLLIVFNRLFRIMRIWPYLIGGSVMWALMLQSGIHATIAGVMLAFAIPFSAKDDDAQSPSHKLENFLHKPVAFIVLPIFALTNTAIVVGAYWAQNLSSANSVGIAVGLVLGKPLGVTLFSFVAVAVGLCRLPSELRWPHMVGAGLLGGIGFTMSIFMSNLAFAAAPEIINASKMSILMASLLAGVMGFGWLMIVSKTYAARSA